MTLLGDCDLEMTVKVNPHHLQNEITLTLGQGKNLESPNLIFLFTIQLLWSYDDNKEHFTLEQLHS